MPNEPKTLDEVLLEAWAIIANVKGEQTPQWWKAKQHFREQYHEHLQISRN